MMITWKHQHTDFPWPWTLPDKFEIFYERTFGWQLHIADVMANGGCDLKGKAANRIPDSGFAVLQVCLSYFETIAKYKDGFIRNGQSEHFFRQGVMWVFQEMQKWPPLAVNAFLDGLYKGARCGLYHGSMTMPGISLTGETPATVVFHPPSARVILNPHRLPVDLKAHLSDYLQKLKNPAEKILRQNFESRFDFDNGITATTGTAVAGSPATNDSGSR